MEEIYTYRPAAGIKNIPPEMDAVLKSKGGLRTITDRLPDLSAYDDEAEKFKALSAPVRLQIMHALLVADLCPLLLKDITKMSDSKLSYHLDILESAGFIVHTQRQKWRIYAITLEGRKAIGHLRQTSEIPII